MRTGAVGVVFLAAVLCFGVQSRRERQTVVLETQIEDADAAEMLENFSGGQNRLSKEVDDSQENLEGSAKCSNDESKNPQTQETETLYIHVCGEVAAPGVYELPAGSRMYEAVEIAGGMTSEAAQEYVNLAQALEDGQQLRIPSREEIRKYQETGKEVSGLLGAGGGTGTDSAAGGSSVSEALINLNTASKEELMTLNGIGAARAEAILSYRDQKGGFRTIEDIMKVPGIKNAAFQKIKDQITV